MTLAPWFDETYIVAEIGINHNGNFEMAKELVLMAARCGVNAVKFQKRSPELCVPKDQWNLPKQTPWGIMDYLGYRYLMEFNSAQYRQLQCIARTHDLDFFASVWDENAVDFMGRLNPPFLKIPSAVLTDDSTLQATASLGKPIFLSTGMSTIRQIQHALEILRSADVLLMHCVSMYPCPVENLNLQMIPALKRTFGRPVGYSGHEVGLAPTLAAVVLGAEVVERHITLDRAMWGSDQAASVEEQGLRKLVKDIRTIEKAMGDGEKRVLPEELEQAKKLRRVL